MPKWLYAIAVIPFLLLLDLFPVFLILAVVCVTDWYLMRRLRRRPESN
jgi:hypothetical protein